MPGKERTALPVRITAFLVALAVLTTGLWLALPASPAFAQEPVYRPWSLRDLFFPRREPRLAPPADVPGGRSKGNVRKKAPKARAVARKPAEPEIPVIDKEPDAKVVLVIGDFLGSGLADGLGILYAENPKIRIVDRSKGSSGFVREDYFNWPKEIGVLIETEKPTAIAVMMGSNDRQQMRVGDTRETLGTDNWNKEYAKRTEALAKAITERKVPFVWVGVPAFRSSKMTSDMLAFNDIYRAASEEAKAEFVDVWDGFVDENGAFITTGPDVSGQPVRLRSDDGINLTQAGKRKLAFYAEKPLSKILGLTTVPGTAAVPALPALTPEAQKAAPVDRTVPISLNDPELDGGTELLGANVGKATPRSPGEKLAIDGIAPEAKPGRADDFSWPPRPAEPATAAAPAIPDTTATVRR
ncbi:MULTISPECIES: SGNH/GDSL hydrolase family protein [unclassified Mesorhizobium]|uniref:SGNH/GDSL hydrolase family protein n=1 Tax=unclassified Mesorhizobium TaxID=325217 RepID=UPI00301530E8